MATDCRKFQELEILLFHFLSRYVQVMEESQNYTENSVLLFIYFFQKDAFPLCCALGHIKNGFNIFSKV